MSPAERSLWIAKSRQLRRLIEASDVKRLRMVIERIDVRSVPLVMRNHILGLIRWGHNELKRKDG